MIEVATPTGEAPGPLAEPAVDPRADGVGTPTAAGLEQEISELELRAYYCLEGVAERAARAVGRATRAGLPGLTDRARLVLADLMRRRRRPIDAMAVIAAVRADADRRGDVLVAARADLVLSHVLESLGLVSESMRLLGEAIQLLPADAPVHLRLDQTLTRAILRANQLPDTDQRDVLDELLRDTADGADIGLRVAVLNTNAFASWTAGMADRARAGITELDAYVAANSLVLDSNAQDTRACVLAGCGELEEAEAAARTSVDPGTALTEAFALPQGMITLARICRLRGRRDEALHWAVRARRVAAVFDLAEFEGTALGVQADLFADAGNYRAAYGALVEAQQSRDRVRGRTADAQAAVLQGVFEVELQRREAHRFSVLAETDALTGLPNRRHLDRVLPLAQSATARAGEPLSLAMLDLDGFKAINDLRSHLLGDAVLERLATLLGEAVRPLDTLVRLGGDEFVLLLPGSDVAAAARACARVRREVAEFPWSELTFGLPVTISIGVAPVHPGDEPAAALDRADRALHRAKGGGRNRVVTART